MVVSVPERYRTEEAVVGAVDVSHALEALSDLQGAVQAVAARPPGRSDDDLELVVWAVIREDGFDPDAVLRARQLLGDRQIGRAGRQLRIQSHFEKRMRIAPAPVGRDGAGDVDECVRLEAV